MESAECNAKMEEFELRCWLLKDEAAHVGKMQRLLEAKVGELLPAKQALEEKRAAS